MSEEPFDVMSSFLLQFAEMMLAQSGSFFPFAVGMNASGDLTRVEPDLSGDPSSQEILEMLFNELVSQAAKAEIHAAAICTNVRITPPGQERSVDAVCVEFESSDGKAIDVFVPYVVNGPSLVTFEEPLITPGDQRVFVPTVS